MIMREWGGGVIITTIQQSQWKMTDVTEEPVQGASTWSSTPSQQRQQSLLPYSSQRTHVSAYEFLF